MGFRSISILILPYQSASITEFWRRWHISLSSWLRDYLYISLGGNRKGKIRQYVNLAITMLLEDYGMVPVGISSSGAGCTGRH
jgi:D-alanyl-lipoteichoic acid acyltransferase DltB (MBOAT superfamily)